MTLYELGCEYEASADRVSAMIRSATQKIKQAETSGSATRGDQLRAYRHDLCQVLAETTAIASKLKNYYRNKEEIPDES